MIRYIIPLLALLALVVSGPALAYVGPGAGLSFLGALWALLLAVLTALAFVVAWPVRRLLRRRRVARQATRRAAG